MNGNSWTKAECDITLGGIGWASVTVDGEAVIDVHLPYPVKPRQTTPLMPFELADRSKRRIRKHGKMRQGASEGDIEKEVSEAKDLEKVLLEDDVVKSRAEEPLTLKRWKPR